MVLDVPGGTWSLVWVDFYFASVIASSGVNVENTECLALEVLIYNRRGVGVH